MNFVLQSKKVRRDSDSGTLIIDEKGDNSTFEEADTMKTDSSKNSIYTVSALRLLPVYSNKVSSNFGGRFSSCISRSAHSRLPRSQTCSVNSSDTYNMFEETVHRVSVNELPHPSKLFGKCKMKSAKLRKFEKPSPVEYHISQLRTKRARMDEQVEMFKDASSYGDIDSNNLSQQEETENRPAVITIQQRSLSFSAD